MNKTLFTLFILLSSQINIFSQTQGISYQAILVDDNAKEIPGIDAQGNYLPNQALDLRFTISDEDGTMRFQEEYQTATDDYGMINVTIGWGTVTSASPGTFMDIDWDGAPKNLTVEISLGNNLNNYIEFSSNQLTFVPYAYHKNITATGTMTVEDVTDLNSDLNVNNARETNLSGNLTVDLISNLNGELNVNNGSSTALSGDLSVQGETTLAHLNMSTLSAVSDEESFIATFENTNGNKGDGVNIKLGKRATKNDPAAISSDADILNFVGKLSESELNKIKGILDGDLSSSDLTYLATLAVPSAKDALDLATTVCDLTTQISNELIDFINEKLHLPAKIGPYKAAGVTVVPEITVVPDIPEFPNLCAGFGSSYEFPDIRLNDIADPLTSENVFIGFTDNDDFTMGAIKAQSIDEWAQYYLDPVFMVRLVASLKGMDKSLIKYKLKELAMETAKSYLQIGVQYSSGNGDYAEWLERVNPDEKIGAGDIVGIRGGKITKDLTMAEQVMAISQRPIVLGNTPKVGEEYLGNNVAFMGQIPVKVVGPVHSGDYIVGKGEIQGYGVAIEPENMCLEDYKYAVGRSWEENVTTGPKMVNTVVGVHNGSCLNVLKQYDDRLKSSEARLKSLEEKIEILLENNTIVEK